MTKPNTQNVNIDVKTEIIKNTKTKQETKVNSKEKTKVNSKEKTEVIMNISVVFGKRKYKKGDKASFTKDELNCFIQDWYTVV